MTELACSICGRPFNESDVIPINGSKEQVAALKDKMDLLKKERKVKKGQKRKLLEVLSVE